MHRPPNEIHKALPVGRLKLGRLLWVFAAALCLTVVVLPAAMLLKSTSVSSRHSFTGSLRPLAAPVSVVLPEGAFLKEILIERNETVYAGQTIALLDQEAISTRLEDLDARLLHDEVLRSCLLSGLEPDQKGPETQVTDTSQNVTVSEAKAACAAALSGDSEQEETFLSALELIEADQSLLTKYLHVLVEETGADAENRDEAVRQVLSLRIAQNRLLERKLSLEQDGQRARQARRASRINDIEKLAEEMQANAELRRRLSALLDKPRLLAPDNGQIVRLRRFPVGAAAFEDTEFVEIRPSDSRGYKATFPIPHSHLGYLEQGQPVTIELAGMGSKAPRLYGILESIEVDARDRLFGSIALQSESVLALDDPRNGIALRGDSTAAVIHIQFEGFNALSKVNDALVDALMVFGIETQNKQNVMALREEGAKHKGFALKVPDDIALYQDQ